MQVRLLLGSALLLVLGCGGGAKVVPVTGRVTLNGKPLADAKVSFQPIAKEKSMEAAGPGSTGKTDAEGKFTLKTPTGQDGAVVGMHRVRIDRWKNAPPATAMSGLSAVVRPR